MKIKIHMKSGKTLVESYVKDFTVKYNNNEITGLNIDLFWYARNRTIFMAALDLGNIEAITMH